jgi:hypothetical protein
MPTKIGQGVHGDFEPTAGHRSKHPNDNCPGGDSRDYADRRPGARWSDGDGANERSERPNREGHKGY